MNYRFAKLFSRLILAAAVLFTFAACGGGGGGGGGGFTGDAGADPATTYVVQLELLDPAGDPADTATSTEPLTIRVTVTTSDRNADPVTGERVAVSADVGTLDPASGSVLTNSDGIATLLLRSDGVLGAGTVSASVTGPSGEDVTATANYQVAFADLQLGYFAGESFIPGEIGLSSPAIPASGSLLLTINAVDAAGEPVTTQETITFQSTCSRSGQATIDSPVTTTNGLATANYTATGCTGDDVITATLEGAGSTASATLGIAAPAAGSINFIAAVPQIIALRGTGGPGRRETAVVTFEVVDSVGTPVPNEPIRFGLSTDIGGITLSRSSTLTDAAGQASVTVNAGNIPTPVRVTASIDVNDGGSTLEVFSLSDELFVTSGLPDQNSISLSAERLSARGGRNIDGVEVEFTVRLADRFNNPVPDGTAATFRTEYGSIQGGCTTVNGACTVTWVSQSPRFPSSGDGDVSTTRAAGYSCPSHRGNSGPCPDNISGPGVTDGLISTVTVVAVGEEVFIDRNANGIMDQEESGGDLFPLSMNLPEAFVDFNWDGGYTPEGAGSEGCPVPVTLDNCSASGFEEEFFDFNNNGVYDFNDSPPVYNGKLCPPEGDGIWCSRELVHVFDDQEILLSSGIGFEFNLVLDDGRIRTSLVEGEGYTLYIADIFNNPPVDGDSVSLDSTEGCDIVTDTSFSPGDTNRPGAYGIPIAVQGDGNEEDDEFVTTGSVTVTVEGVFGISQVSYPCITAGDPPEAP